MDTNMNTTARLVVSGHISPRCMAIDVDPSFGTQDEWRATMENVVDATPEMLDLVTPREAGRLDAYDGLELDPTRHGFVKIGDCEWYVIGYKTAQQAMARVTVLPQTRMLTAREMREHNADYASYLDDVEWLRGGC